MIKKSLLALIAILIIGAASITFFLPTSGYDDKMKIIGSRFDDEYLSVFMDSRIGDKERGEQYAIIFRKYKSQLDELNPTFDKFWWHKEFKNAMLYCADIADLASVETGSFDSTMDKCYERMKSLKLDAP